MLNFIILFAFVRIMFRKIIPFFHTSVVIMYFEIWEFHGLFVGKIRSILYELCFSWVIIQTKEHFWYILLFYYRKKVRMTFENFLPTLKMHHVLEDRLTWFRFVVKKKLWISSLLQKLGRNFVNKNIIDKVSLKIDLSSFFYFLTINFYCLIDILIFLIIQFESNKEQFLFSCARLSSIGR